MTIMTHLKLIGATLAFKFSMYLNLQRVYVAITTLKATRRTEREIGTIEACNMPL